MFDSCCPLEHRVNLNFPLFFASIPIALLYDLYTIYRSSRRTSKFVDCVILHGAYFSFAFLAYFLKDYLNDTTCQGRPNSVSGHTFYHVFYFTDRLVTFYSSGKRKSLFHSFYFFINQILHFVNLSITYLGGYHTPRQMLYGAIVGVHVTILYFLLKQRASKKANLIFYALNMGIWIYVAHTFTTVKPEFALLTRPGMIWYGFFFVALYLEWQDHQKKE
ncbi:hypothetical protein TRFO_24025 [Tritrichomonas foetus]|uniref:PAP2 superfamily protein n=1 Tax=Tritrichomonas foetus TaxID=1144522 RepID=A0A1J4K8F4_9EUKA|nr:hypothetical protein TRFO_24025 [Tritrichomonas foetus]|eukprot:OHT07687.1 hypothetical protein TRFO_24025 [Tritrichomonas foetus]